nr:MAG TPA: FcoT-like thioesterase domain protein [Microviridae sp.]
MIIQKSLSHPRQICYSQLMVMLYAKCKLHRTSPIRHYMLGNATCR